MTNCDIVATGDFLQALVDENRQLTRRAEKAEAEVARLTAELEQAREDAEQAREDAEFYRLRPTEEIS